ncbi:YfjI family protein [bacterium]|nr:YfjI family protein [bacterium]
METPDIFIEMAAYTCLASLLDKRVRVRRAYYLWDTAIYSMIVGPAGIGKSSALDEALSMLTNDLNRKEYCLNGDSTARALMNRLQVLGKEKQITSALIAPDEAKEFFALSAEGMVGLLKQNYNNDKDYEYDTANYGRVFVPNPYVVFSGNTTIDWIESNFKDELLNGGFGRRCLFTYAGRKRFSNPEPRLTDEHFNARMACVDRLRQVDSLITAIKAQDVEGGCPKFAEFQISDKANKWYVDWYVKNDKKDHGNLGSYYTEKRVHLHKYAMLYSMARKDTLVLELEDFLGAADFLERVEESMARIFRGTGKNGLMGLNCDVLEFIQSFGDKISKSAVLKKFLSQADTKVTLSILEGLVACRDLSMEIVDGITYYRAAEVKTKEEVDREFKERLL